MSLQHCGLCCSPGHPLGSSPHRGNKCKPLLSSRADGGCWGLMGALAPTSPAGLSREGTVSAGTALVPLALAPLNEQPGCCRKASCQGRACRKFPAKNSGIWGSAGPGKTQGYKPVFWVTGCSQPR